MAELRRGAGEQFDPSLTELFEQRIFPATESSRSVQR